MSPTTTTPPPAKATKINTSIRTYGTQWRMKCEKPLNIVLNGARMGVSTLFQFIAFRQVNLI